MKENRVVLNGHSLKFKRNELKLTIRQLAEKANFASYQYLSSLERKGKFLIKKDKAEIIAKALKCSLDNLVFKSEIFATRAEALEFLFDSPMEHKSKSIFRTGLSEIKLVEGGVYVSFYDNKKDKTLGFFVSKFEIF